MLNNQSILTKKTLDLESIPEEVIKAIAVNAFKPKLNMENSILVDTGEERLNIKLDE